MKNEHAPTPWHVGPHYKSDVYSREGRVCECQLQTPRGIANADVIVLRVNAHESLVAALQQCDSALAGWQVSQSRIPGHLAMRPDDVLALIETVRSALKLASGVN